VNGLDERDVLLEFLRWQRDQVVATTEGLTEDELRWTPEGRLLPLIGIVNHLTHMEWRWVNGRYRRDPFPPRVDEFNVAAGVTGVEVVDAYRRRAAESDAIIAGAASLDEPCLGCEGDGPPAHVLLGRDEPFTLRWVLVHLVEETAHHAGHADATRELLDGKKMRA
jgi:hypothetical protein